MPECLIGADSAPDALPVHAVTPTTLDTFLGGEGAAIAAFVRAAGFKAAAGSLLGAPGKNGIGCFLFGLGGDAHPPPLLPGRLGTALPLGDYTLATGFADPELAILAFALGAYRFTRYRERDRGARVVLSGGPGTERVLRIARRRLPRPRPHQHPGQRDGARPSSRPRPRTSPPATARPSRSPPARPSPTASRSSTRSAPPRRRHARRGSST
jgi:hypothetical protein